MNTLELLTAAQNLILDPNNWTQGACARDYVGNAVTTRNKSAACFCSIGALGRPLGAPHDVYCDASDILDKLAGGNIIDFNDTHTHAEVMAVWEQAKEIARVSEAA